VLAQRQTRNAERRRLFLNATGVCQNKPRAARKVEKVEITERIDQSQTFYRVDTIAQAELSDCLSSERVYWKYDRQLRRDHFERLEYSLKRISKIHIRRAMQR